MPRLRYDQLMDLGWKYLIPASLLWLGVVAVKRVAEFEDWPKVPVVLAAVVGAFLVYGFIAACLPKRDAPTARAPREVHQ